MKIPAIRLGPFALALALATAFPYSIATQSVRANQPPAAAIADSVPGALLGTLSFGVGLDCVKPFRIRCCGGDSAFWVDSDSLVLDSLRSMVGQQVRLAGYFWPCFSRPHPLGYFFHVSEAVLEPCPPAPVEPSTWGEVKARSER